MNQLFSPLNGGKSSLFGKVGQLSQDVRVPKQGGQSCYTHCDTKLIAILEWCHIMTENF